MRKIRSIWMLLILLSMHLAMTVSYAEGDFKFHKNFNNMAEFGEIDKIKKLFATKPQLRSIANLHGDMRLISEGLIKAAGAKNAKYEIVELLVENGADVNAQKAGELGGALSAAVIGINQDWNNEAWNGLVIAGVVSNRTASYDERLKIIKYLIEQGADVNEKVGSTPILQIAKRKHKEVAQLLLDAGADADAEVRISSNLDRGITENEIMGEWKVVKFSTDPLGKKARTAKVYNSWTFMKNGKFSWKNKDAVRESTYRLEGKKIYLGTKEGNYFMVVEYSKNKMTWFAALGHSYFFVEKVN